MKKIFCLFIVSMLCLSVSAFAEEVHPFAAIRISEVCPSCSKNIAVLTNDQSPDWVELYNDSDADIDLTGLCLSDSSKKLDKFVFENAVIPAHGYIVVYCTGEKFMVKTAICAPFKLDSDGEKVILSYNGEILNKVKFDKMKKDTSFALNAEGVWEVTGVPTPGAENVFAPVRNA